MLTLALAWLESKNNRHYEWLYFAMVTFDVMVFFLLGEVISRD